MSTTPLPTTLEVEDIHAPSDVQLLDDIDRLRSNGISHLVALPQLIVVGDQSSGKSSVLEAVSGIPFPTKDNLCTRFATEVVLRRANTENVKVTISPGPERDPESTATLQSFSQTLSDWNSLSSIIEAAKKSMGLSDDAKTFTDDVLRVDVSGPHQPHLTIVDLPGLIHFSKAQTADDVQTVQQLVRRYMTSARSIILAIVSAKSDYANQIVLKLAREVDPHGLRTLGVITKPDTLIEGSESEAAYLTLAKNQDVSFSLGWHVVKNRDYNTRNLSLPDRNRDEVSFLSNGIWAQLPRSDVAIVALRRRLSRVLLSQIKRELPNLVREIELKLEDTNTELRKIGNARLTENEQRRFLVRLSQDYQVLARAAVSGLYESPFFEDPRTESGYSKRIRAVLHNTSLEFAESMRQRGHRYNVSADDDLPEEHSYDGQETMTRTEYIEHAKILLTRTRGRELPGTFNPMLIADLFREQCVPWKGLLHSHVNTVFVVTMAFVQLVVKYLTQEDVAERIMQEIIEPAMKTCMTSMSRKVDSILHENQAFHPITYNDYFTETIQNIRAARMERHLTEKVTAYLSEHTVHTSENVMLKNLKVANLVQALSVSDDVDMDSYACAEAVDCMFAYYKVAMKTLVDNMARQCIEEILVNTISNVFSPDTVLEMDSAALRRMAHESDLNASRREQLQEMKTLLESGLDTCRKHSFSTAEREHREQTKPTRLPDQPSSEDSFEKIEATIVKDLPDPSLQRVDIDRRSTEIPEIFPDSSFGVEQEVNVNNDFSSYLSPAKRKKKPKRSLWADELEPPACE